MQKSSLLLRARRTLIGDRAFYAMVLAIVVPMIVQNAITNFVSLLDNIMVGRVGTDPMTGVSIANQLLFVFNLCVFGGMAGAGIFAAQYAGAGNDAGVRSCFRFKLYLGAALTLIAIAVFAAASEPLITLYLNESESPERVALTLQHGMDYLRVMLWGLPPFALTQAYASTLRETGETKLPMVAAIVAVLVNLTFNYILIYGHLGAPALGVRGAAIATVLSRYVELAVIAGVSHRDARRYAFLPGAYRSLRVPLPLVRQIILKGMPLLVNEALWSLGVAMLARCYSLRGLDVVAAQNISNTVSNLFNVVYLAMGNATAVILGQALGARRHCARQGPVMEARRLQHRHLPRHGAAARRGVAVHPADLQHLRRGARHRHAHAARLRRVHAGDVVRKLLLLHPPLGRQDDGDVRV